MLSFQLFALIPLGGMFCEDTGTVYALTFHKLVMPSTGISLATCVGHSNFTCTKSICVH